MAFCSRLGMLVKQSRQVPMASMLNSARYMETKLFVGGLSFTTDDHSLKEVVSIFDEVVDAKELNGKSIRVNFANERRGPRYGGGDGGYGGGSGYCGNRGGYGNDNEGSSY
ncbi:hypothetical protein LWI29_017091 [Acer saccharum]|uniref:RRM domain-containing protein n=1 Tax=Acer saccharum TaxID=4024 RepID=A0AA39TQR1_ACESA|nr:hypothetical protein LWI29_017091 [Acer saccharum]